MKTDSNRRDILRNATVLVAAAATISLPGSLLVLPASAKPDPKKPETKEPEVTATEDLMREHGVIRRALLVYFETVPKLRQNAASVDPSALRQTAQLFRTFGEDYHEKMLEEQHIFPLVRKQGGELERYADILTAQHNRGREITDYVLAVTNGSRMSPRRTAGRSAGELCAHVREPCRTGGHHCFSGMEEEFLEQTAG